jgi:hypothetical protein
MGKIIDRLTPSDKERFWAKVDVSNPDGCWTWKDRLDKDGYGQFSIGSRENQKKLVAHRVAKTLSMGEDIPEGLFVMHMCDNPPCCRPDHLGVATHQENMDDMVRKNRSATVFGGAKLDWETVDCIRNYHEVPNKEWAQMLDVTTGTISDIKKHKCWRDEVREIALLPKLNCRM